MGKRKREKTSVETAQKGASSCNSALHRLLGSVSAKVWIDSLEFMQGGCVIMSTHSDTILRCADSGYGEVHGRALGEEACGV